MTSCQSPNKRMQRTRVMDKFVLRLGHRSSLMRGVMRRTDLIRWFLVIPSAVAAWYCALIFGGLVLAVAVGPCINSDYPPPRFCEASVGSILVSAPSADSIPYRAIRGSGGYRLCDGGALSSSGRCLGCPGRWCHSCRCDGLRRRRRRGTRSCSRIRSLGRRVRLSVRADPMMQITRPMSCQTHNNRLQRTVIRRRGRAASTPFHYVLATLSKRKRAAAEPER